MLLPLSPRPFLYQRFLRPLCSGQILLDHSDLATEEQACFAQTPDRFPSGIVIGLPPESLIAFGGILRWGPSRSPKKDRAVEAKGITIGLHR